jgi:hypothetical protein
MRYFIRIAKTKQDDWINGQGVAIALAQNLFQLKPVRHRQGHCAESTYEVEGETEETEAVAAHLLTDLSPKIEPRYVVRFRPVDLQDVGVDDGILGTTGIVRIDFRHRDLVGTKEQLQSLVGMVLIRLKEGQDRIRRFGAPQLRYMLERFADLAAEERPTHTANIIQCALSGKSLHDLAPDPGQTNQELARVRIPEEAIRLRAYYLHKAGDGGGSPAGDWAMAQDELRRLYSEHYRRQFGFSTSA